MSNQLKQQPDKFTLQQEIVKLCQIGVSLSNNKDTSAEEVMKEALLFYIHHNTRPEGATQNNVTKRNDHDPSYIH